MTSRQYDVIDEKVADEILRLHKDHPNLGHEGLLESLAQQGIEVDDAEMKQFMRERKLNPGMIEASWGWVASRWRFGGWAGLGFHAQRPHDNRSQRRFWRRR